MSKKKHFGGSETGFGNIFNKKIVEEEQHGEKRAEYGKALLKELSAKLTRDFGKGFDERELRRMRQFHTYFPIRYAVRPELSWTHYRICLEYPSA